MVFPLNENQKKEYLKAITTYLNKNFMAVINKMKAIKAKRIQMLPA
jgi:hypothetical protein